MQVPNSQQDSSDVIVSNMYPYNGKAEIILNKDYSSS